MTSWERLETIFHEALEVPASDREAWLRRAAADDPSLLDQAMALVRAHEDAGDFLDRPPMVDPADLTDDGWAPGTQVGPYTILEEVGRGGMGLVYRAEDRRLGRQVALKCLPASAAADPRFRERLRREARAAATISHPNVATVFALEEIDEHLLIAAEYVPGRTLRVEIADHGLETGRALLVMRQIAAALAAAHDAGVIHRDLKPENVILTAVDHVKVVDFGIAHVGGADWTRLTREGVVIGTPAYMAPEQLSGRPADARVDIYAAGVLLREMIAWRTNTLAPIMERCLRPNPDDRFQSARELLDALDQLPRQSAVHEGGIERPLWWWRFHQGMAALLYWLMVIPAWSARGLIGGIPGRAVFVVVLVSVIVAANLRLHLWFTSRLYPGELEWLRPRVAPWIRGADWVFVFTLIGAAFLLEERSPLAILLLSFGIGAAVAFLVMEPATTRAAFRRPSP